MNIGKAIKALRKEKGMSQEALAAKAGITQAALSHIERGKRPGTATTNKICEALGISVAFMHIYGTEAEDVPEEKRLLYEQLFPVIQQLIGQLVK